MRFGVACALGLALILGVAGRAAETNEQKVDRIFTAYEKPGSPGCALGVIRDGNFIHRRGYGLGSIELGAPLSPQSVFYMGSVSKQFTAASVVLAAEQGFLSLDDDVRKYIPELPDYAHPITLREMLHHTSGLRDFETLLFLSGRNAADLHSREEMLALIERQKGLNNVPGGAFVYSNTNYFLLGEVIRRATGKTLAEFADENIFKPLGMAHTRFYDDHTLVVPGRVAAYDEGSGGKFLVDWSTNFDSVGAGGLMSSVDDMLLWDRNFYQNKLGKGTLIQELETRGVLNDGTRISYALGLEMGEYRGLPIVEHSGALFGYRTEILRFPEQKFSVVCLCNLASVAVTNVARQVADIYLAKSLQPGERAPREANGEKFPDASKFAGMYLDPERHFVYTFTASGGNLMAWGANLPRLGPNRFHDLGTGTITFDDSGDVMHSALTMDVETFFTGERVQELKLNDAELAAYTGSYTSEELGATYGLTVEKGSLVLRIGWNPPVSFMPIAQDVFTAGDLGTLVFQRDAAGRMTGLSISEVSARNIEFTKVK